MRRDPVQTQSIDIKHIILPSGFLLLFLLDQPRRSLHIDSELSLASLLAFTNLHHAI